MENLQQQKFASTKVAPRGALHPKDLNPGAPGAPVKNEPTGALGGLVPSGEPRKSNGKWP